MLQWLGNHVTVMDNIMAKISNFTLSQQLHQRMCAHALSLALAESCTGGMLSEAITRISGASDYFHCSFITYSNQSKQRELGVPASILTEQGAVSSACAKAMAEGALEKSGCDIALSITGIAGPLGGTPTKPVGTVHFALADKRRASVVVTAVQLHSGRQHIRYQATKVALTLLNRHVEQYYSA